MGILPASPFSCSSVSSGEQQGKKRKNRVQRDCKSHCNFFPILLLCDIHFTLIPFFPLLYSNLYHITTYSLLLWLFTCVGSHISTFNHELEKFIFFYFPFCSIETQNSKLNSLRFFEIDSRLLSKLNEFPTIFNLTLSEHWINAIYRLNGKTMFTCCCWFHEKRKENRNEILFLDFFSPLLINSINYLWHSHVSHPSIISFSIHFLSIISAIFLCSIQTFFPSLYHLRHHPIMIIAFSLLLLYSHYLIIFVL